MTTPCVHLVGAGPGDPRLLTRRAADLLARADVVVLDRPSLDPVADLAPAEAERLHVGRTPGRRAWSTTGIIALLADRARAGHVVVRLKGGDPLVCSRGGEELLALRADGIDVDVVPGVTAATAAPTAARIRAASAVTIAAGNDDPVSPTVDWSRYGPIDSTVVVLVGRSHQQDIATALEDGGRPADTPAALVHGASRDGEHAVVGTLLNVATHRLDPPAAFVVAPPGRAQGGADAHP